MSSLLAACVVCLACSTLAHGQACRTWVSGVGDDANPCSRTAPCKTFAGAISKTAECGEIDALDPGGFGAVTITKCITLDGTYGQGFASILTSAGGNGVIVNVTTNPGTAKVTLRRLSLNGGCNGSFGTNGIRYLAGASLHVQQCDIFNFTTNGIDINLTASGNATIQDTTIRECGGSGISATTTVGNAAVVVTNNEIDKSTNGISAASNSVVTVRNTNIALCSSNGINTANGVQVNVTDSFFANDGTGVNIVAGATARLNNNVFVNNATGVTNNGTGVSPAANNKFIGNLTDRGGANPFTTAGSTVQ